MVHIEIIGILAATLTTTSFIPQAYKIIKTKNTDGISLSMYIFFSLGVLLWLIYGIFLNNLPIIIANSITLCLALIILYFKIFKSK
ncbi:MAG: SemiSWEET transporter [Bacteroidales bacterium]|nr:SemiSWEET transporter [Bacteroidales bacterium]